MREHDTIWDNIRPTNAVRLDRSPYEQGREDGYERGRGDERTAVIGTLDACIEGLRGSPCCALLVDLRDGFRAGEHLKPRSENADRG